MSLANFFDKAAMAASQILLGFDDSAFKQRLENCLIGVAFDDGATESAEGKITLELTINLLSRLYPRLQLRPLTKNATNLEEQLRSTARLINPEIEFSHKDDQPFFYITVGNMVAPVTCPQIFVGSNGWVAKVSSQTPVGCGSSTNPFGGGAAACFGAANAFRYVFSPQLPHSDLDSHFEVSLLDWDPLNSTPPNPLLNEIEIGEAYLVGIGAIGNAALWALARVPGLRGVLHLIDHEKVDLTNLQRYVLADQRHINIEKVLLGCQQFNHPRLSIATHAMSWGEYLHSRDNWKLERVMVAVDSAASRRSIQAALPRWTVNAWTQPGDIGVSRHSFIGDQACLMCLYFPQGTEKNEDQLVTEAIGLPEKLREIRHMLFMQTPLSREFLESVALAKKIGMEKLLPFMGKPLRTLYVEGVCGGRILDMNHETRLQRTEVPMNFQSALAGIMLSAELVANATEFETAPDSVTTKIDLQKSLGTYLSLPARKHISGRCICQDPDYLSAYRNKYYS